MTRNERRDRQQADGVNTDGFSAIFTDRPEHERDGTSVEVNDLAEERRPGHEKPNPDSGGYVLVRKHTEDGVLYEEQVPAANLKGDEEIVAAESGIGRNRTN